MGEYALFAGGYTHGEGNNPASSSNLLTVYGRRGGDIQLVGTYTLSVRRGTIAAASCGNLAFFAGGA